MLFDDKRLLFVDDRHVESSAAMTRVLNPPVKAGACFHIEKPWELKGARASCVVRWQEAYRLYYNVRVEDGRPGMAVATSTNGLSWERPELGIIDYQGSRRNNLIDVEGRGGESCVFVDPAAPVQYTPDVYLAFPSIYYSYPWPPEGAFVNDGVLDVQFAASADGSAWSRDLRGSYIRHDLPDGPVTKCMHMLVGMIPRGRHISQYYVGGRYTHGQGRKTGKTKVNRPIHVGHPVCHRLEQRLDGFVSFDSAYAGGELMTRPFELESGTLRLNIDTSASGDAPAEPWRQLGTQRRADWTPTGGERGTDHGNKSRQATIH